MPQGALCVGLAVLLVGAMLLVSRRTGRASEAGPRRHLTKRTWVSLGVIALAVPATILCGVYLLGDRKYLFISLLVLLEVMLPFALLFERRGPTARELVLLAVLSALCVAGRAAFSALPQFKPVLALVIVSGVALGGEAGFLTGALAMLLSNVMYGQGPWTPWQMFAMGLCGFLAGVLYRRGLPARPREPVHLWRAVRPARLRRADERLVRPAVAGNGEAGPRSGPICSPASRWTASTPRRRSASCGCSGEPMLEKARPHQGQIRSSRLALCGSLFRSFGLRCTKKVPSDMKSQGIVYILGPARCAGVGKHSHWISCSAIIARSACEVCRTQQAACFCLHGAPHDGRTGGGNNRADRQQQRHARGVEQRAAEHVRGDRADRSGRAKEALSLDGVLHGMISLT